MMQRALQTVHPDQTAPLGLEQDGVSLRVMHPKDAKGIANSVDPDESLIWICTVCPDLSVRKLRNITVDALHAACLLFCAGLVGGA